MQRDEIINSLREAFVLALRGTIRLQINSEHTKEVKIKFGPKFIYGVAR